MCLTKFNTYINNYYYYHYAILDGNVEKIAEALKDSDMIQTSQLDGDKDQSDTGAASSAGDETQSAGVTHNELPMITTTVKGMYSNGLL